MPDIRVTDITIPVYLVDVYDKRTLLHNADWRDDLIERDYSARLYLTMALSDDQGDVIAHTSPVEAVTHGDGILCVETQNSVYTFYTSYTSDTQETAS